MYQLTRKRQTKTKAQGETTQQALTAKDEELTQSSSAITEQPPRIPVEERETTNSDRKTEQLAKCVTEFELPSSLVGKYAEDPFFKIVVEAPERYRNFELKEGALYLRHSDELLLCIPDIMIGERRACEVVTAHAHSILAHLGACKTLQWMRTQVWWKNMTKDVSEYCESCHICAVNKPNTQNPMGLLQPMPIPEYPRQSIGIDFVGPSPESQTCYGKFDMIMSVIDNLTCMVHLIPTRQDYKARDVAKVLYEHVFKLHGVPERIVSDRNSLFMLDFWTRT
jgi:hypothetical protein